MITIFVLRSLVFTSEAQNTSENSGYFLTPGFLLHNWSVQSSKGNILTRRKFVLVWCKTWVEGNSAQTDDLSSFRIISLFTLSLSLIQKKVKNSLFGKTLQPVILAKKWANNQDDILKEVKCVTERKDIFWRGKSFLSLSRVRGPFPVGEMVSRRKILSRSRDELHSDIYYMAENDDDDVWYSKEKLYAVRILNQHLLTDQPDFSRAILIHLQRQNFLEIAVIQIPAKFLLMNL